jgi:hypothetical protein
MWIIIRLHKLAIFLHPKYDDLTFLNCDEKEEKAEAG